MMMKLAKDSAMKSENKKNLNKIKKMYDGSKYIKL
jgi:hypothetical protein